MEALFVKKLVGGVTPALDTLPGSPIRVGAYSAHDFLCGCGCDVVSFLSWELNLKENSGFLSGSHAGGHAVDSRKL